MRRDGTAGAGYIYIFKQSQLYYFIFNQLNSLFGNARVGDKHPLFSDITAAVKLVMHILNQHLVKRAALLFPDPHGAVLGMHLDAGL